MIKKANKEDARILAELAIKMWDSHTILELEDDFKELISSDNAEYELPYEGAKEMLLVEDVDDKDFLTGLFNAMYEELPTPKVKKKNYVCMKEEK